MRLILIFIFCSCLIAKAQLPSWQWASGNGGSASDNSNSIVVDAMGNSYVTGYFYSSSIVFGAYTLTNVGNYDMYTVKYDPSGTVLWAKSAGSIYDDSGSGITLNVDGEVLVTGYYSDVIVFGTYTLTNAGGTDIFVVKYDASGNVLWAFGAGDSNSESGNNIACDNSGNVFIAGSFLSGNLVIGSSTLTNNGSTDAFLAKFSGNGSPLTAVGIGDAGIDGANDLTVDANGNVFLVGSFSSQTLAIGTNTLIDFNSSYSDLFVAKFDNSANAIWANSSGGNFDDCAYGITLDKAGDIILTGYFKSVQITFGATTLTNSAIASCDLFVVKYNPSGNVIWGRKAGGSLDEIGYDICNDQFGNIFVTGHLHSSTMVFNTYTITNNGIGDAFIAIYDPNGGEVWVDNIGGTSDDGASGVGIDYAGGIYVAGYFFSSSFMIGTTTLNNVGNADAMLAKLGYVTTQLIAASRGEKTDLDIFPNPTRGQITLTIKDEAGQTINEKEYGVMVMNIQGEIVNEHKIRSGEMLDLSNYDAGVYFIKMFSDKEQITKKLILY
jgi:hypothetical protein